MAKQQKNKGLGRGISAFFTSDFEDFDQISSEPIEGEKVEELSVDEIRANPYQPRKYFDEESLKELADSIRVNGVFQPIIVRKSSIKGYELIAGERRLRACKLASLKTIPAIIRTYSDEIMIQIAVIENLQREDLSPIDEAMAYQMFMEHLSLNQEAVAERVGKSRSYVANFLRLLTLPKEIQQFLQLHQLSVGQAKVILSIKDNSLWLPTAKKIIDEQWTVRQLEEYVRQLNQSEQESKNKKKEKLPKNQYIVESEERLMDKFGTTVQIVEKGERGKIEIEYLSQRDLTRILDVLDIVIDDF